MKSTLVRWGALALMIGTLAACGGGGGGSSAPEAPPAVTPPTSTIVTPPTAEAVALAATVSGETCSTCHGKGTDTATLARSGASHQASYNDLYQNGVIKVTGLTFGALTTTTTANDTSTLTFTMTKDGGAFDCTTLDTKLAADKTPLAAIGTYWSAYDAATNTFKAAVEPSYLSLWPVTAKASAASKATTKPTVTGAVTFNATTGLCTVTKNHSDSATTKTATTAKTAAENIAALATIAASDGIIQLYGVDEIQEINSAKHMNKGKYPFAALLRLGPKMGVAIAPFASAANVSGCENCHTQPFNKHAYIPGTVDDNTPGAAAGTTQQFYVCKGCHSDARTGGHGFWQLLGEAKFASETDTAAKVPFSAATQALRDRAVAVDGGAALTTAESTKYAYKAGLMNDVHMSHAMEFAYPQSMKNCVACHAGKMDETTGIFKSTNFKGGTCISCHTFDGITAKMKAAPYNHSAYVADTVTLKAATCTLCHDGATAPSFKTLHTGGYDPKIYTSTGTRYSTGIVASVDSATFDATTNVLDVKFSATGSVGSLAASSIKPTVIIGLYGYNTKDFIVQAHGRDADGNRLLEYVWGSKNPRFTEVSGAGGAWEVKVDLSVWKAMITDKTIKRAEIAILPTLKDAGGTILALDAPSKTFDLTTNKFDATFFSDIVNVAGKAVTTSSGYKATKGCNTCHDALASTFHSGDRGGNIKVCRLCHVKSAGGSHLELQSRSIDSYVHAIHSFQIFDAKSINFADTFEAMEYRHHTGTEFPRFGLGSAGTTDCESCHVSGMYGVSDVSKSLAGLLSATDTITGMSRNIGTIPSYVTGPATTACGGCHRANQIVADDAGQLSTLFNHWKQNGYLLENIPTLWDAAVAKVMSVFK